MLLVIEFTSKRILSDYDLRSALIFVDRFYQFLLSDLNMNPLETATEHISVFCISLPFSNLFQMLREEYTFLTMPHLALDEV